MAMWWKRVVHAHVLNFIHLGSHVKGILMEYIMDYVAENHHFVWGMVQKKIEKVNILRKLG